MNEEQENKPDMPTLRKRIQTSGKTIVVLLAIITLGVIGIDLIELSVNMGKERALLNQEKIDVLPGVIAECEASQVHKYDIKGCVELKLLLKGIRYDRLYDKG